MDKNGIRSIDPEIESIYVRDKKNWTSKTLREFADARNYDVFDLPLKAIDLSVMPFDCRNMQEFIFQVKRLNKVNFDIPIILDDKGRIADGNHHIVRAFLEGKDSVKAVRLLEMPYPDNLPVEK